MSPSTIRFGKTWRPLLVGMLTGVWATCAWSADADQPGELDTATSLNRSLRATLRSQSTGVSVQDNGVAPAKAREHLHAADVPVEPVAAPSLARSGRRAAEAADARPVLRPAYTPDFSRQTMSFAQLIGQDRIDLPRYDALAEHQGRQMAADPSDVWTMAEIVQEGLAFSPVLRRAHAQLDNATARRRQARADLLPVFSANIKGGYASVKTDGSEERSSNGYRTSLARITQPLFNPTYFHNLASTQANELSSDYRVAAARETVAMSLIHATANLAATRVVTSFSEDQERQFNEIFRYLEERTQAGASSNADLERARTRLMASRQIRIELQADYKSALYEMERLLGELPKGIWLPFLNQLPALPQTKDELRQLMDTHNAELKALREDVVAQQSLISAEHGKLLPTLALSAEHDMQRNISGPTPTQTDKRLVLSMNWSFSMGGKEIYGAQEAKAELRNREARYQEERRRMEQMLEADFAMLQSATQRMASSESEQHAAEAVVSAVQEQLKSGRISSSLLDALDAFESLFAARQRQVQALFQQMVAHAQLLRLIGMLGQMPALPAPVEPRQTSAPTGQSSLMKGS